MDGRKKAERTRFSARDQRIAGKIAASLREGDTIEDVQIIVHCGQGFHPNGCVDKQATYGFTPSEWAKWSASKKRKDKARFKGDDQPLVGRHTGYTVSDCAGRNAVTGGFAVVRAIMVHDAPCPRDSRQYQLHRARYLLPKTVDAVLAACAAE